MSTPQATLTIPAALQSTPTFIESGKADYHLATLVYTHGGIPLPLQPIVCAALINACGEILRGAYSARLQREADKFLMKVLAIRKSDSPATLVPAVPVPRHIPPPAHSPLRKNPYDDLLPPLVEMAWDISRLREKLDRLDCQLHGDKGLRAV